MKERPIIFSGEMVRAILDGRETQTRRVMKPQPTEGEWHYDEVHGALLRHDAEGFIRCPYGTDGDRLWVRETWRQAYQETSYSNGIVYKADAAYSLGMDEHSGRRVWRPSIHMPRWASRLTLEVTGVRVERLQEISEDDAKAEGIIPHRRGGWHWREHNPCDLDDWDQFGFMSPRDAYHVLWESINGPGSWEANSFVWVIEFKRVG